MLPLRPDLRGRYPPIAPGGALEEAERGRANEAARPGFPRGTWSMPPRHGSRVLRVGWSRRRTLPCNPSVGGLEATLYPGSPLRRCNRLYERPASSSGRTGRSCPPSRGTPAGTAALPGPARPGTVPATPLRTRLRGTGEPSPRPLQLGHPTRRSPGTARTPYGRLHRCTGRQIRPPPGAALDELKGPLQHDAQDYSRDLDRSFVLPQQLDELHFYPPVIRQAGGV